jgi:trehalose/maltose hydrolase-like predicted phosphorylase
MLRPASVFKIALMIAISALAHLNGETDPTFLLEATSPRPYTPAYLGNGAMGLVTGPLGTEPERCFLAGIYDHTAGDVPRIASAAAWNEVDIYNGSHWLNHGPLSTIGQYHQTLDMYDGTLRTSYLWSDGNRGIDVRTAEFVSRDRSGIAVVRVTIAPQFAGRIEVRLPLRNWPPPRRYDLERIRTLEGEAKTKQWAIWYPGHLQISEINADRFSKWIVLSALETAPGTETTSGEAVAIEWTGNPRIETHSDADGAEAGLSLNVRRGQTYSFTKYVAIMTSRQAAVAQAEAAQGTGAERLLSTSEQAWHGLWNADVIVNGDPKLQSAIHSMLFYLFGSTRKDLDISIGPMGLSSAGYYGHIFWDADIFMFPALLILHPELARPIVDFRSRTLPAARENAKKNGYKGAMYPWEAGPGGIEATPRFAFQNASSENHVTGDVALAAWQYWLATGDRDWLQNRCWPILRDTADFWASRVSYDPRRSRYVIANVVAVNESDIGVSNDPYTNAIAQKNLQLAIQAARELHLQPHPNWNEVAAKMYVPDSDSSLLWYPLNRAYSPQQTKQAIAWMLTRTERHRSGAMMGTEFYPILAAQIGDAPAIARLLGPLCFPYLRPPFQVVAETPNNQNTNFITGAGAFLQQFVFGYTGLRMSANGLTRAFPPTVPPHIDRLTLKNITVRGKQETLVFNSNAR